jgi:hypothetical protein
MRISPLCATALILSLACSDSPTQPAACATAGSVNVTVTTGATLSFDWSPRCAVALVLVEADASDQWSLSVPDLDETATESSNLITPPVLYGESRAGLESSEATPLVAGLTYEVILWKFVAPNSTVQCQERFGNACLLAVKEFTR